MNGFAVCEVIIGTDRSCGYLVLCKSTFRSCPFGITEFYRPRLGPERKVFAMATLQELEKLARKIVGRQIPVVQGGRPETDGSVISLPDSGARWPRLPERVIDDMDRSNLAHEARHIVVFDREARKAGVSSLNWVQFCERFADPLSPGADSIDFVRYLLNLVEDRLVDEEAKGDVGEKRVDNTNRFFIWNRQGGSRSSLAELEASGSEGKCAAFVEAIFQLEVYSELMEVYYSTALEKAAKEATRVIEMFGKGSLSRTQALQKVLDALRRYCPPPWRMPTQYQPPSSQPGQGGGEGSGDGQGDGSGNGSGSQGQGQGKGKGKGKGNGSGQGSGDGDGDGDGSGSEADGQGNGQSKSKGSQGSKGKGKGQGQADGSDADGESEPSEGNTSGGDSSEGQGETQEPEEKGEEYSESEGSGSGSPDGSNSRGAGSGDQPGQAKPIARDPEKRFEENELEALLKMLERVLAERSKESGRGVPRWKTWSPGDQISSPDEIERFYEDESFGIDPLERRCVRVRDRKRHLLAVFIDSSGSVNDQLFAMLYRVCGELAGKVAELDGCELGVGQFSGGASWVLEPTRDTVAIRQFAEEEPKRLYSGGTTVGEIYGLLPEYFAGYQTADLVVLTDGYVEDGKKLALSLEGAHAETSCEIKLHGVVFRKQGTIKQFEKAKDQLPQFVRVWHLGE